MFDPVVERIVREKLRGLQQAKVILAVCRQLEKIHTKEVGKMPRQEPERAEFTARYFIESAVPIEQAAAFIAGAQSSGTEHVGNDEGLLFTIWTMQ